ncbi:hypothetical protein BJ508DRAFT_21431 [Ascobolus immersus RN42]|uniref:Uncharacterized protein n=1 Tax=Ascobolus immersus RN42 TaxID=1160509 RepID=A0A3N4HSE7_ASCIM|nr:hypothetical protein BJ508DRAFT_21431 [Ascobolus immersus RN42]
MSGSPPETFVLSDDDLFPSFKFSESASGIPHGPGLALYWTQNEVPPETNMRSESDASQIAKEPDYVELLFDFYSSVPLSVSNPQSLSAPERQSVPFYDDILTVVIIRILMHSRRWDDGFLDVLGRVRQDLKNRMSDQLPPQLCQSVARHVLFYLQNLRGIVIKYCEQPPDHSTPLYLLDAEYCSLGTLLDTNVWLRYRNGLLREGQVRLLQAAYMSSMTEYEQLWRRLRTHSRPNKEQMVEIWLRSLTLSCRLLYFGYLRSERVEALIGRYMDEDGVNMDVVRGVTSATIQSTLLVAKGQKTAVGLRGGLIRHRGHLIVKRFSPTRVCLPELPALLLLLDTLILPGSHIF